MSYATNIIAAQQETLPELYEFLQAGVYDRVTSFATSVTFNGSVYAPRAIRRSGWAIDTEFSAVSLTITAPITETIRRYIANQPIEPVKVTIYRALSSDLTSYVTLFNGYVRTVSISENMAQVNCESKSKTLRTKLPKVMYQSYCNHDVFDAGCTLSDVAWRVIGTVSVISGSTITVPAIAAYTAQYFRGGYVRLGTDYRMITDSTGALLSLQISFDSRMYIGATVWIYPGCDGAAATCTTKFSNFVHFLGMPYIPSSNPVAWGL